MRLSTLIGTIIIALGGVSPASADTFLISEVGGSLKTPDGWIHDTQKETFGFRIVPPPQQQDRNKIRELRIHLSYHQGKDLSEELERAIDKVTERAPKWGSSNDRKSFLGASEITTARGLQGLKGTFGEKQKDGSIRYTINKYYFRNSAGKIFCICAYVFGPEDLAKQYEEIILTGLTLSDK